MANETFIEEQTGWTWNDTSTPNTLALNNLAAGAGVQGDQQDLGASPRPYLYVWRLRIEFATTPVVGEVVRVYAKMSDGTRIDNDDGTTAAAVSAENKLKNLKLLGLVIVDEAAASTVEMSTSGLATILERYFQPVIWNAAADNLVATNDLSDFTLTPYAFQLQ